jgi:pyruvate dehydrogenase E1 component alpha subunit
MMAALHPDDGVCDAYRVHGWAHTKGVPVKGVIGELLGNSAGCSNGKGGSMHMYSPSLFGGNGIVGAQVPMGAGVALAHKYNEKPLVSVSLYGDGAANQGQVFEAYNIAKLWDLPAIFVCENNKYGMGTSAERSSANTKYYTRGDYLPGLKVDAMDVLCVKNATEYAREYALNSGPIVLEMETYRYHGHSMSDPDTTYRTRDDIAEMRKNYDPILMLRQRMIDSGWTTEEEVKALEKSIRKSVAAEAAEAEAAPLPAQDQLLKNIYATDVSACTRTHPLSLLRNLFHSPTFCMHTFLNRTRRSRQHTCCCLLLNSVRATLTLSLCHSRHTPSGGVGRHPWLRHHHPFLSERTASQPH